MTDATSEGPSRVPAPGCPPPHPSPREPDIELPPGSCDAHFHVFGPGDTFPFAEDRRFTPVDVPRQQVMDLHEHLGLQRGVLVHSTCHGSDHASLLDFLEAGRGRYRGVALISADTPQDEIEQLDAAGVCGFRLHFAPHLGEEPSRTTIDEVLERVGDRGWHTEVHLSGSGISDNAALLRSLPGKVVIDHMARVDISAGLDTGPIRDLFGLLDTGNVWVKVSGIDRLSVTGPPYDDAVELARRLVAHAPDRTLWGTDFPHPNIVGASPDDGLLVERLADIVADDAQLRQLMVTNPTEFFGFDA